MNDCSQCSQCRSTNLHQTRLLQFQQLHELLKESRIDQRRCVAHQRVRVHENRERLETRLHEKNAVRVVPEAGGESRACKEVIFLVVVQVLVEILPQLYGDTFGVVIGDVLVVNDLQRAALRVIFVVKVVNRLRHLLFGSAAVSESKTALFSTVRLRNVLQPTQQCVLLVTAEARDEIAALREHVQKIEDAEDDFEVCGEEKLRQMLHGIVQMSRETVLDEERCEVEYEEEKLPALKFIKTLD
jgi:hypothetical protein